MVKSYDIAGYASEDGEVFCTTCGDEKTMNKIFVSEEWDYQPCCYECLEPIDVVVLGEEDDMS
ncbi:MAG: hypothetical protein BV459_07985 [Thermoplasmata archaeon M11B2D]|nr:MAG: hypothetical protein BV459_07985 [Thermoplasmata archaeon M11B2D]